MILIISKEQDITTNKVIDWLDYYGIEYYRLNGAFLDNVNDLSIDLFDSINNNLPFEVSKIKVVWYRRWGNYLPKKSYSENPLFKNVDNSIKSYLNEEYRSISYALFSLFTSCYWLSEPPRHRNDDKFYYLRRAKDSGINIPKTFVLNNLKSLKKILSKNKSLINKSMSEARLIKINDNSYIPYTKEIKKDHLSKIPSKFFPTLFQQKIEKQYEIRSFYIDGEFYSMAIFSQSDSKTELDFRRYNHEKPNRYIPYKIPKKLEHKIHAMLNEEGITTCSIDLLKGIDNEYYFLEINSVGQFSMTSLPCNYDLEKKVAEFLIKKTNIS